MLRGGAGAPVVSFEVDIGAYDARVSGAHI